MPSGAGNGIEGAQTAGRVDGAGAQADEFGAAVAVGETCGLGATAAFGGARAGAEAAVQTAAAVLHGGLATWAAGPRAGAAAGGAEIVAGGVAVLQAAAGCAGRGVEFRHRDCRGRT